MAQTAVWSPNLLDDIWIDDPLDPARVRANYYKKALGSPAASGEASNTFQERSFPGSTIAAQRGGGIIELPKWRRIPGIGTDTLAALQEWEGVITDVEEGFFWASLVDVSSGGQAVTEVAEIPIAEISDDDRPKVAKGAIFRLVIGFRKSGGQKYNTSHIYFRRLSPRRMTQNKRLDLAFEDE